MKRLFFPIVCGLVLLVVVLGLLTIFGSPAMADGVRGTLTVQKIIRTGITSTLSTADGDGHKFRNSGRVFVDIANAYTGTITATFVTPGTIYGLPIGDLSVAIPAATTKKIGPFPPTQFNQRTGSDKDFVYMNYNAAVTGSVASSVTIGAFRVN